MLNLHCYCAADSEGRRSEVKQVLLMTSSHCGWFTITSHVGSNPVVYVWELSQMCPAATVFLPFSTVYIIIIYIYHVPYPCNVTLVRSHMIPRCMVTWYQWMVTWYCDLLGGTLPTKGLEYLVWILVDIFGIQEAVHVVSAEESCCFDSHCVLALSYSLVVSLNGHLGS